MPTKISRKKYPRFDEDASKKLDHATYDMNDEECTDQSNHDSITASASGSTGRRETQNSRGIVALYTTALQHHPEGTSSQSYKDTAASIGNRNFKGASSTGGMVSWSDSDGSTYVSEGIEDERVRQNNSICDSVPLDDHDRSRKERGSFSPTHELDDIDLVEMIQKRKDDVDTSHKEDLEARLSMSVNTCVKKTTDEKKKSSTDRVSKEPVSVARRRKSSFLRLKHVEYYSHVNVASSDDEISAVRFISKEDTSAIFCRRMVPLEIPVRKRRSRDDVSAFSSTEPPSVMPTGETLSVQAVHTRRGTVAQEMKRVMLEHVDYLSHIDIASHPHDTSTVICRVSQQIAAAAFINKQKDQMAVNENEINVSMSSCNYVSYPQRVDSMSTLGSTSVTSRTTKSNLGSFDGDGHPRKTSSSNLTDPRNHDLGQEVKSTTWFSNANSSSNNPTSFDDNTISLPFDKEQQKHGSTDLRIKNLKERIKQMQVASTMESLPEKRLPPLTSSSCQKVSVPRHVPSPSESVSSRKKEAVKLGRSQVQHHQPLQFQRKYSQEKPAHARARDIDISSRLRVQDIDFPGPLVKSSSVSASTSGSGRLAEVPSVVTPIVYESDDISTIQCDMGQFERGEMVDVELAVASSDNIEEKDRAIRRIAQILDFCSQKAQFFAQNTKSSIEQCQLSRQARTIGNGIWMRYIYGRSRTEKSIIGVITLSFLILFVLVISIASG